MFSIDRFMNTGIYPPSTFSLSTAGLKATSVRHSNETYPAILVSWV